jgi:hypothetical protein
MTSEAQERFYLAPNDDERVVVVLSDRSHSSGFLLTSTDSAVLSPDATDVLYRSFVDETGPTEDDDARFARQAADEWMETVVEERLLRGADTRPDRGPTRTAVVRPGEVIAPNPSEGSDDISVEVPGTVTQLRVNGTEIYWFEADTDLTMAYDYVMPRKAAGAVTSGNVFTTRLMVRRVGNRGLGVNCTACAGCAVCGGCAGCALCGPSPAAALGLVGVDTTLGIVGVAGSSLAAEALRDR